ncbi:hypothetical protein PtrSN002B_009283 [Pyrenophora tritici-repentis]|uniref:Uncharacterized protein n=2 Tax=Pyrenophora tritici-repentis TaxID=45151 RepID=A0A2W1EVV1_9PLEO|nr:uncharacterized protein PTRG_01794 [Pyrenophora tritici-repentis Pt-1C-BFP]KAA8626496.1 hypothetical protein PtrV1_02176 [Pyrenophora tritici-repentis]EDU41232.1 hypothetical protein PTRG_01794 [Pyrenophora tritici-repentis Pt-1C-BFP]KAF7454920.1 hypothetical protein A1F99_021780 [Pyrenophora tritici-repentis]KAF7578067.1 hypothetical protein PtrM4_023070 [Pyrenophora tritici-repentis]KAG9388678.1 hypothetical protein A1F94_001571 [Pyrenophora tritici-repentis]
MSLTPSSSCSRASSLSVIDENHEMTFPPAELLVRDFGWPAVSPRYRGDHTPESNPDWDHDPLECEEAKAEAFEKMEKSYALYMANLGKRVPTQKKKAAPWARFLPWTR